MAKRILSIMLAVVFIVLSGTPTFASTTNKTIDERIAKIYEEYNLRVTYTPAIASYVEPQITELEKALEIVGAKFIKKLVKDYADRIPDKIGNKALEVEILAIDPRDGVPMTTGQVQSTGEMQLIIQKGNVNHALVIIGDFGLLMGMLGDKYLVKNGFDQTDYDSGNYVPVYGIGGAPQPKDITGKFICQMAWTTPQNDYLYSFGYGVYNGSNAPLAQSKDTEVYRKMKVVYNDLVNYVGTGSRATQRMAAYLGIEIPKETK